MTEAEARQQLVASGRRLLDEGLVARSWGNLSLRLDAHTMAVTPSGIPYPALREEMIVLVDLETDAWSGPWKPSGERKVHREIYRRRPDVNAVVHTHQSAASACSVLRRPLLTSSGSVGCAPYALPGTKALTRGTVAALGQAATVLMANHGVFAVGSSLDEAFVRIAALEREAADFLAHSARASVPERFDRTWQASWLTPAGPGGSSAVWLSTAPFTVAWASRGQPLKALLDDFAQLVGPRIAVTEALPNRVARGDAVLVSDRGALVQGADAEALAMVIEKNARAALGAESFGAVHSFPAWEARLMRWVYRNAYAKQAAKAYPILGALASRERLFQAGGQRGHED